MPLFTLLVHAFSYYSVYAAESSTHWASPFVNIYTAWFNALVYYHVLNQFDDTFEASLKPPWLSYHDLLSFIDLDKILLAWLFVFADTEWSLSLLVYWLELLDSVWAWFERFLAAQQKLLFLGDYYSTQYNNTKHYHDCAVVGPENR